MLNQLDGLPDTVRKMTRKISPIMEDASYLDYAIDAAAIHEKVPWRFHSWAVYPAATEFKVIGAHTFEHDLWTLL